MPPARILIAEDEPDLRELLVTFLGLQGYVVDAVANGAEALQYLQRTPVGLLISDINMPDLDGIELLNHLRKQKPAPAIIIISGGMNGVFGGLSAGDPGFLLTIARALGAGRTLPKPFALDDLLRAVRELIGVSGR